MTATATVSVEQSTQQGDGRLASLSSITTPFFENSRSERDPEVFARTKESIRKNGIIQPIVVRPSKKEGFELEVIAGFGRYEIAHELEFAEVPVLVKDVNDKEAYEIHLSENLDREQLSFFDEINAAKQYVSFYEGDKAEAAKHLGWSKTKMNERLELLLCTDEVLDALKQGKIKPGHAVLLAPFEKSIQNNTLNKVISDNLSVKALKERARKVQLPLENAKFDTSGCAGCEYNSQDQSNLFDSGDDGALCSKPKCYVAKTQEMLSGVVEKQQKTHGKVIFMTQSVDVDRRTVSQAVVGDKQFNDGCLSCESRACLVDDRPSHEGELITSQCLDRSCFNEIVEAKEKAETEAKEATQQSNESDSSDKDSSSGQQKTSTEKASSAPVKQKTPEKVKEIHKKEIREFAGQHLKENQVARMAMLAISLEYFTGESTGSAPHRIQELVKMKPEQLNSLISELLTKGLTASDSFAQATDGYRFMASMLAAVDGGNDAAVKAWTPTEESLSAYYMDGLKGIANSSNAVKALEKETLPSKKGDAVKALLKAEHDWTEFAPAPFKQLLQ
jgi:PRTRC genetic system ParB family protein